VAVSADLRETAGIPALFDLAEKQFGPVDILVNNATGSLQDTFRAAERDWMGCAVTRVSARTAACGAGRRLGPYHLDDLWR
jgi:3-oxoacyl-[acyl-carrier protein] reductase